MKKKNKSNKKTFKNNRNGCKLNHCLPFCRSKRNEIVQTRLREDCRRTGAAGLSGARRLPVRDTTRSSKYQRVYFAGTRHNVVVLFAHNIATIIILRRRRRLETELPEREHEGKRPRRTDNSTKITSVQTPPGTVTFFFSIYNIVNPIAWCCYRADIVLSPTE